MYESNLLLNEAGLRIVRRGERIIEVRVRRNWVYAILFLLLLPLMAVCAVGFTFVTVQYLRKLPEAPESETVMALFVGLLLSILAVGSIAMTLLCVAGAAVASFGRRFTFHLDLGTCEFRHVPGFGLEFRFEDIESIVVCSGKSEQWNMAWLCLCLRGWKKMFRIQGIARATGSPPETVNELQSAANLLAELLNKPITYRDDVNAFQTSWR